MGVEVDGDILGRDFLHKVLTEIHETLGEQVQMLWG